MADTKVADSTQDVEKKNRLLKALKELFEILINKLKNHKSKGATSLIERMDNIQQEMENLVEKNEISSKQLEEMVKVTGAIVEKANIITPENAKETIDEIQLKITQIEQIQTEQKNTSEDFLTKKIINYLNLGEEDIKSLTNEMKVINANNSLAQNELIFTWKDSIQKVTFNPQRYECSIGSTDIKITDVYDENGILKDGFEFIEKEGLSSEKAMIYAFCKNNNIQPCNSAVLEEVRKNLTPKQSFLYNHLNKKSNERIESQFFVNDASFHVRDKKTDDMIILKPNDKDPNSLDIFLSRKTKSIDEINTSVRLGNYRLKTGEESEVNFLSSIADLNINFLLQSDEVRQCLELNGISEDLQRKILQNEAYKVDEQFESKVTTKKGIEQVTELKEKIKIINENRVNKFYLSSSIGDKSYNHTFISLFTGKGKELSISFDKDGFPQLIYYKNQNNYNAVYDVTKKIQLNNCEELKKDKDFSAMFSIFAKAIDVKIYEDFNQRNFGKGDTLEEMIFNYATEKGEVTIPELQGKFQLEHFTIADALRNLEKNDVITQNTGIYKVIKTPKEFEEIKKEKENPNNNRKKEINGRG